MKIPFNKPFMTGKELDFIRQAHRHGWLAGKGIFTSRCQDWLKKNIGCNKAILAHSGTAALEMAALLADIQPGDEIIMPSYTFVSTANAFVLRGGIPVFVNIREDTLNIDETKIEAAITKKTKAIVPVHYAGVGCDMDVIMQIAKKHRLLVIEDAAHGIKTDYKKRPLGSIGHMAALSFHETKNVISGEGGALLINDSRFWDRSDYIADKGTNRQQFIQGRVDKYTWIDIGLSFYPSELIAAFLWAQLKDVEFITRKRLDIWRKYHQALEKLEDARCIRRPIVPGSCRHNGHMYYLLLSRRGHRNELIARLERKGIAATFHYVPLHNSPAGKKFGRVYGSMETTQSVSERLIRLPLWIGLEKYQDFVIKNLKEEIGKLST